MVFDRMIEWLSYFKKHLPNIYFWAYTNGISVTERKLILLAKSGLNEVRFNIAATGYDSPSVFEAIRASQSIFDNVAVEIPSIPKDYKKLIGVLPDLDRINIKYLNLHEYILVPENPDIKFSSTGSFILGKKMKLQYDKSSLKNTEKIEQYCRERKFGFIINNCSLNKKEIQLLYRRLVMGQSFKKKYEKLRRNGLLETYLVHPEKYSESELIKMLRMEDNLKSIQRYFIHPSKISYNLNENGGTVAKIDFFPPMGIRDKRVLYGIKLLNNSHSSH